uniref:Uncharacterized protein n=1 Tax=Anopheles christyi TaxID=43041 RepID=A0A182KDJ3_9DIPT
MKLFGSSITLLLVLIIGLVWSEQVEEDNDTNDLETAESAFHIDPKTVIFTGLAGIGALVVKGLALGTVTALGGGKLLLLAKHAGNSHNSGWDDSSSKSYSSHPSYPTYKSYSSSYSSSDEAKSTAYTGSLKVSGSLTPVSSKSSSDSSSSSSSTSAPTKTSLSLDDVDDPLPEN